MIQKLGTFKDAQLDKQIHEIVSKQFAKYKEITLTFASSSATAGGDEFASATQQDLKSGGDGAKSYGWNVLNSASADAIDANITNAGKLTVNFNAISSNCWNSQFDGVFIYKTLTGDFDVQIYINSQNSDANYESIGIMARDTAASSGEDWVRILLGWVSGTLGLEICNTANNVSDESGNVSSTNNPYLRMTRSGSVFSMYSKATSGADWTLRKTFTRNSFASSIQVGIQGHTVNTSNTYVVQVDYFLEENLLVPSGGLSQKADVGFYADRYLIVSKNANIDIWLTSQDERYMYFTASGPGRVTMKVYKGE